MFSPPSPLQYAVVLILIIIFEIVSGIVGFVFSDTTADESEDTYRRRLGDAIVEYDTNDDAERALDFLQDGVSKNCCKEKKNRNSQEMQRKKKTFSLFFIPAQITNVFSFIFSLAVMLWY